ncbi:response regulator [Metapseudomonas boanensis]|uniref:Response regulator transcription factor n=1 Tax=Metapseudomonas boanensis TaxID=2822138 RepID=A0ABS5XFP1_9GAMM|nr:response regulator transcription factor [Pseudomonas boanensis]
MAAKIRIGIVDDHPLLRQGVASALKRISDFQVVEQGSCADDAVDIAVRFAPDVLLMDVNMPGDCFGAIRSISSAAPGVRVMMLTVSECEDDAYAALEAGAQGYVLKGVSGPELVQAIRKVAGGESFITPAFASRLLNRLRQLQEHERHRIELTHREEQIIREVAQGLTNREVANKLGLSEKTVKYYMTNVMQKLHARNRVEAVTAARRQWEVEGAPSADHDAQEKPD